MSDERLSVQAVMALGSSGAKACLNPCGGCSMNPRTCQVDGERALSYDPHTKSAQCLKNRVLIKVNGVGQSGDNG